MKIPRETPDRNWQTVTAYHAASKHHFHRSAEGPGGLDWANQPDPFRRFAGARFVQLPLADHDASPPYDALFGHVSVAPQPVDRHLIALLLEYSLAITAWKEYQGSRWALRANPSSGNLHPTEGYLVLPAIDGIGPAPAVYHYAPEEHGLEERTAFSGETWQTLMSGFPSGAFLAGLTSIHWREAWKYGIRAYRYCQHDLGHALAALRLSAAALGWRLAVLETPGDATIAQLLGLDRVAEFPAEDREIPGLLAVLWPGRSAPQTAPGQVPLPAAAVAAVAAGVWRGRANALSDEHVSWPWIDDASAACEKPDTPAEPSPWIPLPVLELPPMRPAICTAAQVLLRRRSAVAMDGRSSLSREAFYAILARLLPTVAPPWDALAWEPSISLGLFVHRVRDLQPGLYLLARPPRHVEPLRRAVAKQYTFVRAEGCPPGLELYQLAAADVRAYAERVSCEQEIAADGIFSLGMFCDWPTAAAGQDAWFYRRMFWETGMIGQVLYLEADAAGVAGTGIGCFFDDAAQSVFHLAGSSFQSLYHFTVGGAVEDPRLTTLPPYDRPRGG